MRCHCSSNASTAYCLSGSQYACFPPRLRTAKARTSWEQDARSRLIRAERVHDDPEVPHDLLEVSAQRNRIRLRKALDLDGPHGLAVDTEAEDVDSTGIARRRHDVPAERGKPVAGVIQTGVPDDPCWQFHHVPGRRGATLRAATVGVRNRSTSQSSRHPCAEPLIDPNATAPRSQIGMDLVDGSRRPWGGLRGGDFRGDSAPFRSFRSSKAATLPSPSGRRSALSHCRPRFPLSRGPFGPGADSGRRAGPAGRWRYRPSGAVCRAGCRATRSEEGVRVVDVGLRSRQLEPSERAG